MKIHSGVKTGSHKRGIAVMEFSYSKRVLGLLAVWAPTSYLHFSHPIWGPVPPKTHRLLRTLWSLHCPAKLESCFKVNILSMKEIIKNCVLKWYVHTNSILFNHLNSSMFSMVYNLILKLTTYMYLQTQFPLLSLQDCLSVLKNTHTRKAALPFHWDHSLTPLWALSMLLFYSLNVLFSPQPGEVILQAQV